MLAILCFASFVGSVVSQVDYLGGLSAQATSSRNPTEDVLREFHRASLDALHPVVKAKLSANMTLDAAAASLQPFDLKDLQMILSQTRNVKRSMKISSAESFTCKSLPKEFDPHYFCSGVVDYPFIVPNGVSVENVEAQAREAVLYLTSFINAPCLSDMKKLVCSSLYQPCVANVVADDPSTYMTTEAPAVKLPYVRPCGSVCVAVTHYGTTCGYIIEAFGLARDCLAVDPYTGIMTYDFASTPMSVATENGQRNADGSFDVPVCNDLPSTIGKQMVHDPYETYVGDMCTSITRQIWVPASSALDPTLAPFLPPYALQREIERTVATYEGQNPAFWETDCRLARRQYMCGAYFSTPHPDDTLAMFFGTVYTPSYTHRSVCEHYLTTCPAVMLAVMPGYCDLVLPSGAAVFPNATQAVFTFDLGYGPMSLYTEPHYQTNVTMVLPSECPYGTVIPEDRLLAIDNGIPNEGTACALSCPPRTLRDAEYDLLNTNRRIAYWFSVCIGLCQLFNLSILKRARLNIFVVCAVAAIFALSVLMVTQIEVSGGHSEDSMCSSNASWYDVKNFGVSVGNNLCTIVALFSLYQQAFMYWVLVTLSVEIWLRVVRGVKEKDINSWRRWYLTIMGLLSLGYAVTITYYGHPNIAVRGVASFTCAWIPNSTEKIFYSNTIFEIVCFGTSIVLFGHVIYVCVKTSLSVVDAERKPLKKIWKSYSMIFLFLALHLILYSITVFYLHVKLYYVDSDRTAQSEQDWYECLFATFKRTDDLTYLDVCGDVPHERAGVGAYLIEMPIIFFTSLVLLYITLYKEVREFWHAVFLRFLAYAGVKFLALQVLGKKQAAMFSIVRNKASSVFSSTGQSDVEMEEGVNPNISTKPTAAGGTKSLNPFAATGVPRSDSYLPENYQELKKLGDVEMVVPLEQHSESATEHNSARDSEADRSQALTHGASGAGAGAGVGVAAGGDVGAAESRRLSTTSSRRNVNVPDTIASESDAANEHSIYTTLPSFNGAAEALMEIALNEALQRGEEGRLHHVLEDV